MKSFSDIDYRTNMNLFLSKSFQCDIGKMFVSLIITVLTNYKISPIKYEQSEPKLNKIGNNFIHIL